jgi:hypothetical protein
VHGRSAMRCSEHNRLRQHYEAALRNWGHVILSPDANLVGALSRQAAEIKQKPFDERMPHSDAPSCGGFYVGSKCRCASGLPPCSTRFKTSSCRLKSVSEVGRGSNLPQTVATCSSEGFVVSPYTFFKCQRRFPHASNMLRETQFREIHSCLPGRAFKAGGSIFRQSRVECTLSQILKRCGLWTLRGRNNHH